MPDLSKLEALIARLAGIDFSQSSEQDTREIAVNTVIGELGWDTLDRNEVAREYSVRGGRVDYCLRSETRNLVLIEVKRAGTDLAEHQEQLLRYAFDEGASLAALTDGLVWWLYLPMEKVSWEQRRFARVNFREQQSADAAATLYRFLNRNGVTGGEAQEEARREFESQERERRVKAALQEAWERVLRDPESLLREEFSDKVKEISGYTPDQKTIANFLQGTLGSAGRGGATYPVRTVESEAVKQPPKTSTQGMAQSPKLERRSLKAKRDANKPEAFWLDGKRYEVKSSREIVRRICDILVQEDAPLFEERVLQMDRTASLFSESQGKKHRSHIPGSRLYVAAGGGAGNIEKKVRRILCAVRGSDDSFCVERAEPPQSP